MASEEELKAFSPKIENLLLDISEPSYTRRVSALISQRGDRNILKGVSSSLIIFLEILFQHQERIHVAENKLKEAESLTINISHERDQALFFS